MDRNEQEQLTANIAIALDRAEFFLKEARDNLNAGKTYEAWAVLDNISGELEEADDWFRVLAANDESDENND